MLCYRPVKFKLCMEDTFPAEIKRLICELCVKQCKHWAHRLVCKEWRLLFVRYWPHGDFYVPLPKSMGGCGRVRDHQTPIVVTPAQLARIRHSPEDANSWPSVDSVSPLSIVVVRGVQANGEIGHVWYARLRLEKEKRETPVSKCLRRLPAEFCDKYLLFIFSIPQMRFSSLITQFQPTDDNSPVVAAKNGWGADLL
jgi:hypothetical protein